MTPGKDALHILLAGSLLFAGAAPAQLRPNISANEVAGCADRLAQLNSESQRLESEALRLDEALKALHLQLQTMQDDSNRLLATGTGASSSYQLALQQYNDNTATYTADSQRLNQDVALYNQAQAAYQQQCAGRAYDAYEFENLPAETREKVRPEGRRPAGTETRWERCC